MRLPFVSRDRYDELRDAHMDLLEKYHALKEAGQVLPVAPKPVAPSASARRERATTDGLVDRLAGDLARNGIPNEAARREAERLRAMAFGTDGLPE